MSDFEDDSLRGTDLDRIEAISRDVRVMAVGMLSGQSILFWLTVCRWRK